MGGLVSAADARDSASTRPWTAWWTLRRGTLADPAADRAVLEQACRAFAQRADALGALLACAAAIETYYCDETPLEPLDVWIAQLDALLDARPLPWPNAECGAEVKQRRFDGDFERLLAWWRDHKARERALRDEAAADPTNAP